MDILLVLDGSLFHSLRRSAERVQRTSGRRDHRVVQCRQSRLQRQNQCLNWSETLWNAMPQLLLLLLLQKYMFRVAMSHKLLQDHCTKI